MHTSCPVPTVLGCCSWSGLGSASLCAQRMRSGDYLNVLNDQVIPSMDFFLPWWHGHIPRWQYQDSICERVVQEAWDNIFTHGPQSADLKPIENLWDVLETALRSCRTLPSSIQDLGEKWMPHWKKINLVTLQKLIETMPQQMRAVIKAKGGPTKYKGVWPFFWPGSVQYMKDSQLRKSFLHLLHYLGGYVSPQIVRNPDPSV